MFSFKEYIREDGEESKAVQWVKDGDNRASITAIAKSSVGTELHPGSMTVYRGVKDDSVDHEKVGSSWTKEKKIANKYAGKDGEVISMKIGKNTPAVDLSKLLPTKLAKDKEVFVAKVGK